MMDTDAWRAASGNSIKVLLALVRKDNGGRNGNLAFSCREAADLTGLSVRTCHRCLVELQELGFIACTQKGAFSRKVLHASLWRYTWQAWPDGKKGPTREYEKWRPDGNTRLQVLSRPIAVSNTKLETDPATDAEIATDESGKSLVSTDAHSDRIATLTGYQGGPLGGEELEQRKQANPSSAAPCDRLRGLLIDRLAIAEPGEQSRIASAIGSPGGTLSKFLAGRNLPQPYQAPLAALLGASQ
ncbi:hypothetical protein ACFO0A_10425 [Novosphingobium tardum]|uniref:Helix-turn-helix domain-containing protein n=1 Tax=Novosphingobium tardum TaxID=1538021 RepID=A0ABV8RRU1_9SPHN